MRNPAAAEVLHRTRFYKVGHHGSHNATPREFVEDLIPDDGVLSMVSTRPVPNWPYIPKPELLAALEARHVKLVRSDDSASADQNVFHSVDELYVDVKVP
jgi:beta-lactamase superfamily II metal-dependent hydrolase